MARIIVETAYEQPITQAEWDAAVDEQIPCLELRNITWVRNSSGRHFS